MAYIIYFLSFCVNCPLKKTKKFGIIILWYIIPKHRKAGKKVTVPNIIKNGHVIYASNGVCTVEDIKNMAFVKGDPEKTYYILKPLNDKNSTIYIPEDNEILMGKIRDIISPGEIDDIVAGKSEIDCEWIEDRKQRTAHYKELFTFPHPAKLLPEIKLILRKKEEVLQNGKKQCAIDRDAFENALRFIREEFTFTLNSAEKALELIETAIGATPTV